MKKVCIVTGTRAEYGLLKPLIRKVDEDKDLELQLVVTGTHLSPEFGLTYNEIIDDDFKIDEKVEILMSSDTSVGTCKSMGIAMISLCDTFERLKPDIVIILGDRYEMLCVASVSMVLGIPLAHIHGGETTEGAIDEAIRHSITKMSYLHFTSNEVYRKRVVQLGEDPKRVFNVGAICVESINNLDYLKKEILEKEINFKFDKKVALCTFHPTTLEHDLIKNQFENILSALDEFEDLKVIFTKSNSDAEGRIVNNLIDDYVINHPDKSISFFSMGQLKYLSAMKYCSVVIGNSSSGIIEAPILKKPTINIGDRQKGRLTTKSIINCNPNKEEIVKALDISLDLDYNDKIKKVCNLYGDGNTSYNILLVLKDYLFNDKIILKKKFYDIEY